MEPLPESSALVPLSNCLDASGSEDVMPVSERAAACQIVDP